MEWYNYADLIKWAKLKNIVIKTGEFKDTGNPARDIILPSSSTCRAWPTICLASLCTALPMDAA